MTEIDYAEYANTGSPAGQQLTLSAPYPLSQPVPGLAIVVPPQSGRYQVTGFLPLAQSNYYISFVVVQLFELTTSTQVAKTIVQTVPQVFGSPAQENDLQTFGPFSLRARFDANAATKEYALMVSRYTPGTPDNPNWTLLLDDAGANAAYICADTV